MYLGIYGENITPCRNKGSEMGDTGLGPTGVTKRSGKQLQAEPRRGGAISGADNPTSMDCGPDLQRVVNAWPTLPETVRRNILATVEASQVEK